MIRTTRSSASSVKTNDAPTRKLQSNSTLNGVNGTMTPTSIYEFSAKTIDGEEVSLERYKGHVCIIVNVASRCGHTKSNYEQLVELYEEYGESKGLRVLAFPCNQFGGQEPGDSSKIKEFCAKRNVTFDLFEKVSVNGKNAHPLWIFLKEQIAGPKGKDIKWNFTKFIINDEGVPVERHQPAVKPLNLVESLQKLCCMWHCMEACWFLCVTAVVCWNTSRSNRWMLFYLTCRHCYGVLLAVALLLSENFHVKL